MPVTASATFTVGVIRTLDIVTPASGAVFPPGTTEVPVVVDIRDHDGASQWQLEEPFPDQGTATGTHLPLGRPDVIQVPAGAHDLTAHVALVSNHGFIVELAVQASARFFIAPIHPVAVALANGSDADRVNVILGSATTLDAWTPSTLTVKSSNTHGTSATAGHPTTRSSLIHSA